MTPDNPTKPPDTRSGDLFPDLEPQDTKTRPMGLHEMPAPAQYELALNVIAQYHPRIAATISSIWGHKECGDYIANLIMSGGDGVGRNRVGFRPAVSSALMSLATLHDEKFVGDTPKMNPFNLR